MQSPAPQPGDLESLIGTVVAGKYRIDRVLGRGGMGAVFSATNATIGKRVALKFLTREASRDRDATLRFQREAEAASVVESEHIVHVFDSGTTEEGLPFLVMELLAGEDLRTRLQREGMLEIPAAVDIATQVLRALVRAHAAGIVHRDLKPDNLFLCRRDDGSLHVKVVDFGISKLSRGRAAKTLTRRGTVLGTAYYMAPEQAQAAEAVDQRADLYGVGTILFEMLGGRPPHIAPTHEAVLVAICTKDAPDVRTLRPEVPAGLARALGRALQRDREQRVASAEEFLELLGNAWRPGEVPSSDASERAGSAASRSPGVGSTTQRRRLGTRRTLVAGVIAALLGFTLTAVLVARKKSDPTPHSDAAASGLARALSAPSAAWPPTPSVTALEVVPLRAPPPVASMAASASARPVEHSGRPAPKKPDGGVARSLELSTREP